VDEIQINSGQAVETGDILLTFKTEGPPCNHNLQDENAVRQGGYI